MPSELRLIIFTPREFGEGLSELNRAKNGERSPGQVSAIKVSDEKVFNVAVEVLSGAGDTRKFDVDTHTAAAALIAYCRKHSIPLAKAASKSLQLVGNNLALRLTLGTPETAVEKAV